MKNRKRMSSNKNKNKKGNKSRNGHRNNNIHSINSSKSNYYNNDTQNGRQDKLSIKLSKRPQFFSDVACVDYLRSVESYETSRHLRLFSRWLLKLFSPLSSCVSFLASYALAPTSLWKSYVPYLKGRCAPSDCDSQKPARISPNINKQTPTTHQVILLVFFTICSHMDVALPCSQFSHRSPSSLPFPNPPSPQVCQRLCKYVYICS